MVEQTGKMVGEIPANEHFPVWLQHQRLHPAIQAGREACIDRAVVVQTSNIVELCAVV